MIRIPHRLAECGAEKLPRGAHVSRSMSRSSQPDLFAAQPDLLGPPPKQSYAPSLATVRSEVNKVLEKARIARELPWTAKEVAFWKTVFPQMTNWLPADEAEQLRSAFMEEICRLEAASVCDSTGGPAAHRRKKAAAG